MTIELSLTHSLAASLGLKLSPSLISGPNINHYYVDMVTKGRQKNLFLFNTYTSWICPLTLKEFRLNPLEALKKYLRYYLLNEGLKEYIVDRYISDINDVHLSLTNNKSTVARMSSRKKDIHFFYKRYYDTPNALELLRQFKLNAHLVKNYQTQNDFDYFTPYVEMHANIINKYKDDSIEEKDHQRYFEIKDEEFSFLSSPTDLRGLTLEEIRNKAILFFSKNSFAIYSYQYFLLLEKKENPTMEDYFEVIHSHDEIGDFYQIDDEKMNLIFMKLDEELYSVYKDSFLRKYVNKLPLDEFL